MSRPSSDPRQRLLDAGLKIFAHRGYAGTSVLDLAKEAKVTKPTLYYYFASKEGLFQALIDQSMDERLRLMREAAPPEKGTSDQLTDIILAMTDLARRRPELLRLGFALAFAAPGEAPATVRKHHKMRDSYLFLRAIIEKGQKRGVLDPAFTVDELTLSFLHLIQQSVVMTVFATKSHSDESPIPLPPQMEPRRKVELFLHGAANSQKSTPVRRLTKVALLALIFGSSPHLPAQTTNVMVNPPIKSPAISTNAASATVAKTPDVSTNNPANTAPSANASAVDTNAVPPLADVRPVPLAVRASHPELATVSPIAANASDPHALDLQACFQFTAVRDDSLKISMHDIEIARAQLSQSIAALWPTFTGTNQQQFIHYGNPTSGFSFSSLGIPSGGGGTSTGTTIINGGNRNYESQSHITMNYTVFNGGQNYNTVGASAALVAARRQTLARDYQTIYQDVAQAFYNVLQYEGDLVIQHDLIEALSARVDDLKDRVALGRSRPSEFLQAQTDLANAHVTEEQQKGSLNAARETVAFYIGVPSKYFKLKETQSFPSVAQLETYLQRSGARPDVLSQLESLRQAERNLSVAQGQVFPTVTASGDYLASQDPVSNQIDATMTLQISMPIFDGGLILGQIHQNKELVRQSALNVEQLQRTADEDTRTAYVNFNASVAQVIVLREAALLAAKNLEAQVDDYRKGVVSNLDVLTALQDYQNARQQLHNANMQTRLNLINLHVAAGLAATGPNANNQALPTATSGSIPSP